MVDTLKWHFVFLISLFVVVFDQTLKFVSSRLFVEGIVVIPNFFMLLHTTNTGAGFGILQGQQLLLIFFSIFFFGLLLFFYDKIANTRLSCIALALIFGGIAGNLIDRVFHFYVIDFLRFNFGTYVWPTFNIADSSITVGAVLLFIDSFYNKINK